MRRALLAAVLAVTATTGGVALAQVAPTGAVGASTVKLPDGPGSVAGLAKPAELDLFSAQVGYSLPIKVPSGGGVSPSVAVSYSGALGNGPLGVGWQLAAPAIRRSLAHGVPHYDDTDELTIEGVGSGRLVPIGGDAYVVEGAGPTIRVRRYGSYFEVTDGDGTRYRFGHTGLARQADGTRVAAWFLEEVVNLAGEAMRFEYATDRGQVYLQRVVWGPGDRYRLELFLDGRPDVVASFATGFEVTTARRYREARTTVKLPSANPVELARYAFAYADQDADTDNDGPVSQLTRVTMTGRRAADGTLTAGATMPPVSFRYAVPDAARSWVLDGGGWVLDQRGVALVDVDGDGADDLLRLEPGATAWRKNLGGWFSAPRAFAAGGVELGQVRFLDTDGDARPELVRVINDEWRAYPISPDGLGAPRTLAGTAGVPLGGEAMALADIDGDGRVDVLESVTGGLRLRRGVPAGLGPAAYLPPPTAADPNVGPGLTGVRVMDANGDGLADLVWLTDAWMKVYLGKGDGTFLPFAKVLYPWGTSAIPLDHIHLVDLDRDGVLDLVRVDAGKVRWFGGRAGFQFEAFPRQLDRPTATEADVRVTFADVDGNGSEEVVWSNLSAMWALDLAGGTTRSMVASIDDGMGEVTTITYGTSTQLSLAAEAEGMPWAKLLPRAMAIPVRQETVYADGTPSRTVMLTVRDGFWDGVERRFGGFLIGRTVLPGDTVAQVRIDQTTFHAGLGSERVLRGKPLEARTEDGAGQVYSVANSTWAAVRPQSLAGAVNASNPLLSRAIVLAQETRSYEGVATPIVTRTEHVYDAEARPIQVRELGRLDLTGDERTTVTQYASDDVTWVRDRVIEEALYSGTVVTPTALVSRTRHLFGNHVGNPLAWGQIGYGWPRASQGLLWKGTAAPRWVVTSWVTYDAHGNPITTTDGAIGVGVTHSVTYDAAGLFPVTETLVPVTGRTLTWSATWDQVLGAVSDVTDPIGAVSHVTYDGLGRVTAMAQNAQPPHQRYVYDWTAPRPRTFSYVFDGEASELAAKKDQWQQADTYVGWRHSVTVADSTGEALYSAAQLDANQWLVSGWKRKDARGRVTEILDGFTSTGLPVAPPTGLRRQQVHYDALDRPIEQILPGGARTLTTHRAFEQTVQADGLGPVTSRVDGLGRVTHTERALEDRVESVDATYDAAGRILAMELQRPAGVTIAPCTTDPTHVRVVHCFTYDSFGRLVEADDPDIGLRQLSYDDGGRLIRHVNGAGQGITLSYDRGGRLIKRLADDGTQYEYGYDVGAAGENVAGRLAWVKEPTGRVDLGYDALGRNTSASRNYGTLTITHSQVLAASGAVVGDRYVNDWMVRTTFDMAGRVIKLSGDDGSTRSTLWEAMAFDNAGRVAGERFGNGVVAAYGYDTNGLTSSVGIRRSAGGASLYDIALGRNAFGAVTSAVDSDGVGLDHSATFTYDLAGRLTGATLGKAPTAGQPDKRFGFAYAYDGFQNMVSRQMTMGPRTLGQYLGTQCYGQNGAGPRQLTSVVVEGGPVMFSGTIGGGDPGGGTVDPCSSPTSAVITALTYDDAGRQITDGGTHMTYDGLDQLVGVDLPGGGHIAYAYGYDGQRIQSSDTMGGPVEHWMGEGLREVGGNYEQYISMGGRIVAKVTLRYAQSAGAGVATSSLMVGRGIGVVVGLVLLMVMMFAGGRWRRSWRQGVVGRGLVSLLVWMMVVPACGPTLGSGQADLWRPQQTTYFHTGFGPGPVLLTSEAAAVVDERRAEPFGQAIDSYQEGVGVQDAIDYTREPINSLNKPTDARTQWSYHGARWMAPQTARWLTPDPPVKAPDAKFMAAPWKLHPYQYVDQNPVMFWDPGGLWPSIGLPDPKVFDPGKEPVGRYLGNDAHDEIAAAYRIFHALDLVFTNSTSVATILGDTGFGKGDWNDARMRVRPDIYNSKAHVTSSAADGDVWEIKSDTDALGALSQALKSVEALRAGGDARAHLGTERFHGWLPAPGGVIYYWTSMPGVILYHRYVVPPAMEKVFEKQPSFVADPAVEPAFDYNAQFEPEPAPSGGWGYDPAPGRRSRESAGQAGALGALGTLALLLCL
ncbi:MAG: FG-GAP-like repeat-containing protein [Deltaproteobacteria bacterium]|nr:FG-GAP-like repeat-containing protein [Deltaproteobacteria bacterium]